MDRAFTLIELLVVVAIITVLLAMLMPALDAAVYQAQLTVCGARQKAVSSTILSYSLGNKRAYPDRGLAGKAPKSSNNGWINAQTLAKGLDADRYDVRPELEKVLSINKLMQCPLTKQLDLVDTPIDVNVEASYAYFWGWRYITADKNPTLTPNQQQKVNPAQAGDTAERGMYRVGDRFTWEGGDYNVLLSDIDLRYLDTTAPSALASHPDQDGKMSLVVRENELVFTSRTTLSRWMSAGILARGLIDVNHLFDDGSVGRYNDVLNWDRQWGDRDKRMGWVPVQYDERRADRYQIPAR